MISAVTKYFPELSSTQRTQFEKLVTHLKVGTKKSIWSPGKTWMGFWSAMYSTASQFTRP
jgi:hypothetical protein